MRDKPVSIVIHVDRGLDKPYARAYLDRVDYRQRLPHVESEYACGRYPPNYPVPSKLGPITTGLSSNVLIQWPADENASAIAVYGDGSLTLYEIIVGSLGTKH